MVDIGAVVVTLAGGAVGAQTMLLVGRSAASAIKNGARMRRSATAAREILGLHRDHSTTYRHDSVHPVFPSVLEPHPDNLRALVAAAGNDYVEALREEKVRTLDDPLVRGDIEQNLVLIGSPSAEGVSRLVFGYVPHHQDSDSLVPDPSASIDLPYRWMLDKDQISERSIARRMVPGLGWVARPNWTLMGPEGEVYVPTTASDGTLESDFLLVTKLPNFLTPHAIGSGRTIVSFGGTHGTGTRAVELLYRDRRALTKVAEGLAEQNAKPGQGFQMLFKVGNLRHSQQVGTYAREIEAVSAPLVLPSRAEVWTDAAHAVAPRLRRWHEDHSVVIREDASDPPARPAPVSVSVPKTTNKGRATPMADKPKELKFAPRKDFETILEWAVIPTFDLLIELPAGGVVLVYRKIAPYANTWALPGLRMYKPEGIDDALARIARAEVGLELEVGRRIIDQYVGRFRTEHDRQDLSTGYLVRATSDDVRINPAHFTRHAIVRSLDDVPKKTGAMYRHYLRSYFGSKE